MRAGRRWVHLAGAVNVRDIGGLPTADGCTTASGRLLRADNLQGLTDQDVQRLVEEHGVRLVVDLRSDVEVRLEGPGPLHDEPGVRHTHLSLLPEAGEHTDLAAADVLPWQNTRRAAERNVAGPETVAGYYLGYLRDRPDSVVAALRAIAGQQDGAAVVHCAAGKDRTGVLIALALSVARVQRGAIVEDYVASSEVLPKIVARLTASPTYAADLAGRSLDSLRPRAETMRRFLGALDVDFGTPGGWLDRHGFTLDEQQALRCRLVA